MNNILKYHQFINENYSNIISYDEYWDYGDITAVIHSNINNVKNWLNNYGDYDKTEEIIKLINSPVGCLTNINVNKEHRGGGYGNIILESFIDKCINEDVGNIILVADLDEEQNDGFDLVKWYESKGFKKINNIYDNPVLKMEI